MSELRLSVNIDHVATLRQARRALYPDPAEAATLAEDAGAHGITVHLREDRRHIQDSDLEALRGCVRGKLNLEIAGTSEMIEIAERTKPHQVTLVPERPDEITTEGGLDLRAQDRRIQRVTRSLRKAAIEVSVFVDPEQVQIERAVALEGLCGLEINTDRYTRSRGDEQLHELKKIRHAATFIAERGTKVFAGHGLTTNNVGAIAAIPEIEELNIGHWLVSRAVVVGLKAAVAEMLAAMVA